MSHTLGPLRPIMPNCPLGPWSPCIKQQIKKSIFSQWNKLNRYLSPYSMLTSTRHKLSTIQAETFHRVCQWYFSSYFEVSIMFTDNSD